MSTICLPDDAWGTDRNPGNGGGADLDRQGDTRQLKEARMDVQQSLVLAIIDGGSGDPDALGST